MALQRMGMELGPLTLPEILSRFALAAAVLAPLNVALGFVFARLTGVPKDFPPFSPLPIVTGSVGGPLIATVGYLLLWVLISSQTVLHAVFVAAGVVLLVASYSLPRRLSFTRSPRFAGVTVAAQLALGFLHTLVVGVSIAVFLWR